MEPNPPLAAFEDEPGRVGVAAARRADDRRAWPGGGKLSSSEADMVTVVSDSSREGEDGPIFAALRARPVSTRVGSGSWLTSRGRMPVAADDLHADKALWEIGLVMSRRSTASARSDDDSRATSIYAVTV